MESTTAKPALVMNSSNEKMDNESNKNVVIADGVREKKERSESQLESRQKSWNRF